MPDAIIVNENQMKTIIENITSEQTRPHHRAMPKRAC